MRRAPPAPRATTPSPPLPPNAHADDPLRSVLAALTLVARLASQGLPASVGLTVGEVFCGIAGSTTRREYTVLGDSVNLSARLMQHAGTLKAANGSGKKTGGVVCDDETRRLCFGQIEQEVGLAHDAPPPLPFLALFQRRPEGKRRKYLKR